MQLRKICARWMAFWQDEEAATAAEYSVIAALIAFAIVAAVSTLGTKIATMLPKVSGAIVVP